MPRRGQVGRERAGAGVCLATSATHTPGDRLLFSVYVGKIPKRTAGQLYQFPQNLYGTAKAVSSESIIVYPAICFGSDCVEYSRRYHQKKKKKEFNNPKSFFFFV